MPNIFDDIETPTGYKLLTKADVKQRLSKLVGRAFETLERNLFADDEKVQVQAAMGILDRSGYGPHSKITVEESHEDLSNLSNEELKERAMRIAQQLTAQPEDESADLPFDKSVH
jgi:hypothetical protein